MRELVLLTIPATLELIVLRVPIVRLLYQRGRFGPQDTEATGLLGMLRRRGAG